MGLISSAGDYVDHEFDSVMKEEPSLPIADRGSPSVLKKVIARARRSKPYIGAMAERLGTDVREYGSIGFDLLLGADILRPIDAEALTQVLSFSRTITNTTSVENRHASVLWVVDTRDSGHPLFWARPIAEVVGSQGMLLRQFVARFATPGPDIRPKYECVGNQDMSTGHHKAINSEVSLEWVGDRRHCRLYHALRHNP